MSNDIEKSDTGVWVDTQTDQVVTSAPVEGVQLVPPGGELTPAVKATIERHGGVPVVADDPDPVEGPAEEEALDPDPVEEPKPRGRKVPAPKG